MNTKFSRPNPYVGPRAFQTGEMLYGRDRDILNLYYLLLAERVVLLFSPSGAGKSSLIQAGLIPRLREKFSFIPVIRVNQEPPESLSKMQGFNRYVFSALLSLEETAPDDKRLLAEQLAGMSLSAYLAQRVQPGHSQDEPAKPVFEALIFDQFEEILTTAPNDYEGKQAFFDQLGEALRDTRRWALFSARQDYAAAFEPYLRAIPTRFANRYRLDLLDAEMALQAIRKPAQEAGVDFTSAAAQKLVDDLRRVQTQRPDGAIELELGRYVETVQLQVVCYRLWNNLSADETTITEKHIASIGSVNESLSAYYTDQVGVAEEKLKIPQRIIREWFNNQLITKQGIRSQVMLEPEKSGGLDNQVIRFMESAHLVRAEKRAGSTWFELAHDRLIEPIRTDNEKWLKANLSLLQQQADLWNKQDRPDSLLLREKELAQARLWVANHEAELLPYEIDFLLACKEEENRALRLKRRNQVISVLGGVAMILAIIAFLAYRQANIQREQANIQRAEAQRQERVARAGQLAAQSHTALDEFPQRSLLLALEALKVTQNFGEPPQAAAQEALRGALDNPRGFPLGTQEKPVTAVAFNPDGSWLAIASEDGSILLFDRHDTNKFADPIKLTDTGDAIHALAFSTDGKWLAAASGDIALLWKIADIKSKPLSLEGHYDSINAMAFSYDNHWLATGSIDQTVLVWDLQSSDPAQAPRTLEVDGGEVTALAFNPQNAQLAVGCIDHAIRIWDLSRADSEPILLSGHEKLISALAFSPDGRWLASGSRDNTARLWDTNDFTAPALVLKGHEDWINALAFSGDGHWLATASGDSTARLWDLASTQIDSSAIILRGHLSIINALSFSPDHHWLATGSADHSIRLWDLTASDPGAAPSVLRGHDDQVRALAFSPNADWLASASDDHSARLWITQRANPAESPSVLHGLNDQVNELAFSADGKWLAAGSGNPANDSQDNAVLLWKKNPSGGFENPLRLDKQSGPILSLAISADGHWLASGSTDKTIALWDLTSPNPSANPKILSGHEKSVTQLLFSADGHWLASGSVDQTVRLWDLTANDPNATPRIFSGVGERVTALAFSSNIQWIAVANGSHLRVWNVANPNETPIVLNGHEDTITSLAFNPGNTQLASGSRDNTTRLWNASKWTEAPVVLQGHTDWVTTLAFSSDSHWLATGSRDKSALLWDLKAPGSPPLPLLTHQDVLNALAFSADNRWLATTSDDRTAVLWNLSLKNPADAPVILRGHEAQVTSLVFSPDNKWLATGSMDNIVRLWTLSLDELIQQACASAGRNLSQTEWSQYFPSQAYVKTCPQWLVGQ